jgi:ABC-2 type transport system ATP-binding protein
MSAYAIETQQLCKRFAGKTFVDHLDLRVPEGSIFGLVGPNGAGKTTTIRMLMGILKPTSGNAWVLGQDINEPSGTYRTRVGYVSDFSNFYPHFRAAELLEFCKRVYPYWDQKRCRMLIDAFELPVEKRIRTYSKGMKTQLALIIALSIRPQLLIMDEPTSGLDPVVKQQFLQLIMQEVASGNTTVFYSTHHLQDLERIADYAAVIYKGKVLFSRSLEEMKQTTRRIQVVFPNGLPAEIRSLPQILHIEEQGKIYSLIVSGHFHETIERIRSFDPLFVEALDLKFEELFVYTMKKEGYVRERIVLE